MLAVPALLPGHKLTPTRSDLPEQKPHWALPRLSAQSFLGDLPQAIAKKQSEKKPELKHQLRKSFHMLQPFRAFPLHIATTYERGEAQDPILGSPREPEKFSSVWE